MSFFTLSTGNQAEAKSTFEISGGTSEPIPGGSILLAMVTEAKWDEYQGERLLNLRWDVVGKEYTKRVIFQNYFLNILIIKFIMKIRSRIVLVSGWFHSIY